MFSAALKSGAASAPTDPQFNYVTMLLHGDGTNGAQNNTFLDSSSNNFTITRNGNTTQGSFSPYGSNWSNYFTTSDYLQFSGPASGTGTWTIEGWFYFTATPGGDYTLFSQGTSDNTACWLIWITAARNIRFYSNGPIALSADGAVPTNVWTHIAVVSNSSNITIYVNGVSVATGSYSGKTFDGSPFQINRGYGGSLSGNNCYISNARLVVGTAVYTSSFTPSTTPLTAISGTSLLTCQSNRFIDNSSNNYAATVGGSPSVQRFSPFAPTAAYSTATIGGSGYFDGSGDYLSVTGSALDLGTSDFTVEFWAYRLRSVEEVPVYFGNTDQQGCIVFRTSSTTLTVFGISNPITGPVTPTNTWVHIAITRQSGTANMFINGVSSGTATFGDEFDSTWSIGGSYTGTFGLQYPLQGYLSSFRVVAGTAVYTSNFTPPAAPPTAITNTSLLCNFTNGAIYDNAMMNDLETVGNAQISTSVKKYGTGSLAFDGSGDYLLMAPTNNFYFGAGDFTIEFWLYPNDVNNCDIFGFYNGSGFGVVVGNAYNQGPQAGTVTIFDNISTLEYLNAPAGSVVTGQWQHLAFVRYGSSLKIYVNGVSVASSTTTKTDWGDGTNPMGVGRFGGTLDRPVNGYIDDFRITKGYARYTANFTPPTAAFPNQ